MRCWKPPIRATRVTRRQENGSEVAGSAPSCRRLQAEARAPGPAGRSRPPPGCQCSAQAGSQAPLHTGPAAPATPQAPLASSRPSPARVGQHPPTPLPHRPHAPCQGQKPVHSQPENQEARIGAGRPFVWARSQLSGKCYPTYLGPRLLLNLEPKVTVFPRDDCCPPRPPSSPHTPGQ